MPVLKPSAGFLPICDTVFEQIEHWASALKLIIEKHPIRNNVSNNFFIIRFHKDIAKLVIVFLKVNYFNYFHRNCVPALNLFFLLFNFF